MITSALRFLYHLCCHHTDEVQREFPGAASNITTSATWAEEGVLHFGSGLNVLATGQYGLTENYEPREIQFHNSESLGLLKPKAITLKSTRARKKMIYIFLFLSKSLVSGLEDHW